MRSEDEVMNDEEFVINRLHNCFRLSSFRCKSDLVISSVSSSQPTGLQFHLE